MAQLISTQKKVKEVKPKYGSKFTLKELQEYVDGYVEFVYLKDNLIMVVNEDGICRQLPLNPIASFILCTEMNIDLQNVKPNQDLPLIVGNVLILRKGELEGEEAEESKSIVLDNLFSAN